MFDQKPKGQAKVYVAIIAALFVIGTGAGITYLVRSANLPPAATTEIPAEGDVLAQLQKNQGIEISFAAEITFKRYGEKLEIPSELALPSMPIEWMGLSFTGKVEGTVLTLGNNIPVGLYGPNSSVTDQVHGTVSGDGKWLSSLTYSRQIIRSGPNDGLFFKVTFKNLPFNIGTKVASGGGVQILKSGSDIQKYVESIEYTDKTVSGGRVLVMASYLSTEWKSDGSSQLPAISVVFTPQATGPQLPTKTAGGGMMG